MMTATQIRETFAAATTPALAHLAAADAECLFGDRRVAKALRLQARALTARDESLMAAAAQFSRAVGETLRG